jgi:hypothetical protein
MIHSLSEIPDREERIREVLADTYNEMEQKAAFDTYLSDYLHFPFEAIWRDEDEPGHAEQVTVMGMAPISKLKWLMLTIKRGGKIRRVPAYQIAPLDEMGMCAVALEDYAEWFKSRWQIDDAWHPK